MPHFEHTCKDFRCCKYAYITKIAKAVEEEANNNRPESEGIEFAEGAGFVNGSHPLCSLDGSSTRFYSKSVFHSAKSIGAFRNYISAIPPSE